MLLPCALMLVLAGGLLVFYSEHLWFYFVSPLGRREKLPVVEIGERETVSPARGQQIAFADWSTVVSDELEFELPAEMLRDGKITPHPELGRVEVKSGAREIVLTVSLDNRPQKAQVFDTLRKAGVDTPSFVDFMADAYRMGSDDFTFQMPRKKLRYLRCCVGLGFILRISSVKRVEFWKRGESRGLLLSNGSHICDCYSPNEDSLSEIMISGFGADGEHVGRRLGTSVRVLKPEAADSKGAVQRLAQSLEKAQNRVRAGMPEGRL